MLPTYLITLLISADEFLEFKNNGSRTKQGNTDYLKKYCTIKAFF